MTSTVLATATGIACGKCSHWANGRKVTVRHASVAAVHDCATGRTEQAPLIVKINSSTLPVPSAALRMDADIAAAEGRTEDAARAYEASVAPSAPMQAPSPGRYAIRHSDGVVRFYKIGHGKEGTQWAGRIFLDIQASDELHPIKDRSKKDGILAAIMIDPDGARKLYATELERCMDCNRTLTDETSRREGRGPDCRAKH